MRTRWIRVSGMLYGFFCCVPEAAAGNQPPVLAVFDIDDRAGALDAQSVDQLTDYLATRLGEGGRFRVVPRDAVHRRLRKSKRQSYRTCYQTACQVEMGRELAAGKIVAARILRIGSDCRLTLHLYDLARAATDATASIETGCGIDALPDALDKAVVRIGGMPGAAAPAPGGCPPGQIDIAGHCCWPGQDWGIGSQRCVGEPACPNGFIAEGAGCVRGCARGQVDIAGHCCWPGQDWGTGSGRCIGAPDCPRGFEDRGDGCVELTPAELGERCEEVIRLPCLRTCQRVAPDAHYMNQCMGEKESRCMQVQGPPHACGADLAGCTAWCEKNVRHKKYCISSCKDSYEREEEKCRTAFIKECENECPRCDWSIAAPGP